MGSMEGGNPLLLSSPEQNDLQEESTKDNDLINKTWTESKKLWQIAGPSIFSRLSMFSMTIITQAFAGHLGDLNLAAISIVTTVIISICFGFLVSNPSFFFSFQLNCSVF